MLWKVSGIIRVNNTKQIYSQPHIISTAFQSYYGFTFEGTQKLKYCVLFKESKTPSIHRSHINLGIHFADFAVQLAFTNDHNGKRAPESIKGLTAREYQKKIFQQVPVFCA